MAIVVTVEVPGMTKEQYEQSRAKLGVAVKHAPGFIAHASGAMEGGYFLTEIWQSQEDWERWVREAMTPAAEGLGVQPAPPQVRQAELVLTSS